MWPFRRSWKRRADRWLYPLSSFLSDRFAFDQAGLGGHLSLWDDPRLGRVSLCLYLSARRNEHYPAGGSGLDGFDRGLTLGRSYGPLQF